MSLTALPTPGSEVSPARDPLTAGRTASRQSPLPPAIIVGGGANALSVARSLGRAGVKVYALNRAGEYVCQSRYCRCIPIPTSGNLEDAWTDYLLGPASEPLRGAVVLACSDPGVQILARHRDELLPKFRLDESNPDAQLCMLNKLSTYRKAVAAGVPTPRFWVVENLRQIAEVKEALVYPLIVKPLLSHVFEKRFGKKFVIVQDYVALLDAYREASEADIEVMLVELIPGPDDRLCSYYTYLDANGAALFDFTKRVIRRFPPVMGGGCYHVTDWNPELRDISLQLFRAVGLRGLANVEYKRDERDGQLKLIECNARFTAANCLVTASGLDLALFVYNRLIGRPQKPLEVYKTGKRLWYPLEDFLSFRRLRRQGQLSLWGWLASLSHPKMLPYFRWTDPLPSLVHEGQRLKGALARRFRRIASLLWHRNS